MSKTPSTTQKVLETGPITSTSRLFHWLWRWSWSRDRKLKKLSRLNRNYRIWNWNSSICPIKSFSPKLKHLQASLPTANYLRTGWVRKSFYRSRLENYRNLQKRTDPNRWWTMELVRETLKISRNLHKPSAPTSTSSKNRPSSGQTSTKQWNSRALTLLWRRRKQEASWTNSLK